jgi:2-octaprenyl-6-methoxyphenol hydroxylase
VSAGPQTPTDTDIAIVGGGLVGASLALALAPSGRRITLVESALPAAAAPSWDERCIALNAASQAILARLGVWAALAPSAVPITATHISERGRFGVSRFTADEAGLTALGYNLPVRQLAEVLWAALPGQGVQVLAPARVQGLKVEGDRACLTLEDRPPLTAALIAAADGAHSPLRQALGVSATVEDYGQTAIVSAIRVQRPQPGVAWERFTPEGPIAVLPKAGDACSLVWTLTQAQSQAAMALDDEPFRVAAQACFGERLGRFTALGRRQHWPLSRVLSARLHTGRCVFLGNAAHALHPVAAQGFNLGLRDVAALADVLAQVPGDPGAAAVGEAYAEARRADGERTAAFTDGLVRLFSNRLPGLSGLRALGLLGMELLPPVKQAVLWQNLGFGGSR